FKMIRPPPTPTLFPYTTLFRSNSNFPITPEPITAPRVATSAFRYCRDRVKRGTRVASSPNEGGNLGGLRSPVKRPAEDRCDLCRSEEHTSELQSRSDLVCRLLL